MKIELNTRLTELTSQWDELSQEASPDFRKMIDLLISISILFNRTNEKRLEEERMAVNERRTQVNSEYARTFKGFGFNKGTLMVVAQAAVTMGSPFLAKSIENYKVPKDLVPTIIQGTNQAIGSLKGFMDEANRGEQDVLRHTIEKTKMFGDDLARDAQRSQSHVSELLGLRKQMDNDAHNTASRMT